jgi:hypothetical protein
MSTMRWSRELEHRKALGLKHAVMAAAWVVVVGGGVACSRGPQERSGASDGLSPRAGQSVAMDTLPAAWEIGDTLRPRKEWPQPRRSPGVTVDHPVGGVAYDLPPEVRTRAYVPATAAATVIAAAERAECPKCLFDEHGRVQGMWVSARVDSMGDVIDVAVISWVAPEFAREVDLAARRWQFDPARSAGRAVSVWVVFMVEREN